MDRVTLFFNSTLAHFSQLITGLEYLKNKQKIELKYQFDVHKYPIHFFKIDYNGLCLFFDMADNSDINLKIYEECDFYVKRMLLKTDYKNYSKLIPFGLNYSVFIENSYLKYLFLKNHKFLKYSLKYSGILSKILGINDSINNNSLSNMESPPYLGKQILFRTRLWDPDNNETKWKKKERIILNHERITLNRLLKLKYKSKFKGGIYKDSFSEYQCPDLLLSNKDYHKSSFIKHLKTSSIGLVNQGLEDSIGWKMGEYVANSLAVITSSIDKYELPGGFAEGENYLKYESIEECIELTELLFKNDVLRTQIQKNNQTYYKRFLHPGAKITHIFDGVNKKILT